MDKFDKILQEAVQGYEAPYNAQAWANVSGQLGPKGGPMKWIIGTAAVATLLVGTVYFMQDEEQPQTNVVTTNNNTEPNITETELIVSKTDVNPNTVDANGNPIVIDPALNANGNNNSNPSNNGNGITTIGIEPNNGNNNNNNGNNAGNVTEPNVSITEPAYTEPVVSVARYNAKFNSTSLIECAGNEFIFTPEDISQTAVYGWDFGDGTYSNAKVGTHTYTRSGNFVVSLVLKDVKTNKTLSTSTVDVVVNPKPVAAFAWEKTNEIIPTVSFINLTEDAQTWAWDIKGMKTSTDNQFDYTFRKKGTYMVELTAENEFGCQTTIQKPIVIESDYNLLAPTAFSPNGSGGNDNFIPYALQIMDVEFTMVIYDKAGATMYQTNNAYMPWDGTNYNNNSPAPAGAYVWKVQFKNANGEMEFYEGQVIIIN